jgi:hypothetical protein
MTLQYVILDADVDVSADLGRLRTLGISCCIRYIDRFNSADPWGKVIQPKEAAAYGRAGMLFMPVYEVDGRPSGTAVGAADGTFTKKWMATLGMPAGGRIPIAYTVDFDAQESDMPGIKAAFAAFGDASGLPVWCYGSGAVTNELLTAGLIAPGGRWLTCSNGFRGTEQALASGAYDMRQLLPTDIFPGLNIDPDVMHGSATSVGYLPWNGDVPDSIAPDVATIQGWLNVCGATPPLDVDGVVGGKTVAAVKAFQLRHSLSADGVVGPLTAASLSAAATAVMASRETMA